MNVGDLQSLLTDVGKLLRTAGASRKADELDVFCRSLDPYRGQKLPDLLALIIRAEEIIRTGVPPAKPARPARQKHTPEEIVSTFQRLEQLYQNAADASVSREQIILEFARLEKMNLTLPQLRKLGVRLDVTEKNLKKDELLKRMQQSVLERKGAADRVLS